jgi:hypothetical protein
MITIIITTLLTIILTFLTSNLLVNKVFTDFQRVSSGLKISRIPFVPFTTANGEEICIILDNGEVISITFDKKGKLTSKNVLA